MTVTETDNGSTVCLAMGGTLTVTLHDAAGTRWQEVQAQGDALRTIVGRGTLPVGVTGGFYSAVQAGTAVVDSSRPNCPQASGGAISCHSLLSFQVHVQVS